MINFIAGMRPSSPAPSSRHLAISSQHLLGQARAHQAMGNIEEAKKSYSEAVDKAKTEHEKKPGDRQAKEAFDAIRNESFTFLSGLQERATAATAGEHSPTSPMPNQLLPIKLNHALNQRPLSAQRAHDASIALSNAIKPGFVEMQFSLSELGLVQTNTPTEEKNAQVEYLFEKALSTLGSLELPNKPSLFLVYAHDNPSYGKAEAVISRYLIDKLAQIRVNLYSDQTPMGQASLHAAEDRKEDGKLADILTSQLCLLPARIKDDIEPVDKVVVCCSEVLGHYLKWPAYKEFHEALRAAYFKDQEAYRLNRAQAHASAIREVVKTFSYRQTSFHHVLTEIAFLQIREESLKDRHGIISLPLTANSHASCLAHFMPETAVRIGDIPLLEAQAQAGQTVYPNQSRHLVLFKLIERVFVDSDEARAFLNRFWQGYSTCIARLERQPKQSELEFVKLVDGIFDKIRTEQYRTQAEHLAQTRVLHQKLEQKLLPPKVGLADLREALYQHYQLSKLSIQRVSGETASLDHCYINLAIVESQAQREKDQKELKKQALLFERLPSGERLDETNPDKLIPLEKLFETQKLRNGSQGLPKRILIQGRAGIGKTTLCKKLVYEFYQKGLWRDTFDTILWLPLRQLKAASQANSIHCLENLLCQRYFSNYGNSKAQTLAKAFLDQQDKTLYILDGLDEVTEMFSENHPLNHFLKHLLSQPQVLITSRPAGVDASQCNELDLELETIGFSSEDTQTYIERFVLKAKDRTEIKQFIDHTPLIQSLVNIPIQLDALCYSWDSLAKSKALTIASLYEAMVSKLWSKDSKRLEKRKSEEKLIAYKLKERIAPEENYLSYLAFKGLEAGKIEFSWEDLSTCEENLYKTEGIDTDTYKLKGTSFLNTADAEEPDEEKRSYHFLHLTFQEYFAAKFLVKYLQTYTDIAKTSAQADRAQKSLELAPTRREVEAFISTHKYNPRYEIVWWMVAGLLKKGAALENFFNVLEQSPQDLIGVRHQQVIMGCLNEARTQLENVTVEKLEADLMQWLHFELKQAGLGNDKLSRQHIFPEHLLCAELLNRPEREKGWIIRTLGNRSALSTKAISLLITFLTDGVQGGRSSASDALSKQRTLSREAISALSAALEHDDQFVGSDAAKILGKHHTLPGEAITALSATLARGNGYAAKVLGEQHPLPQEALAALIAALKADDRRAKWMAAEALGNQSTLSIEAIAALTAALTNNDDYVRENAADALRKQHTLPVETALALITALADDSWDVRSRAAEALGNQSTLPEKAITALIKTFRNQYWDNIKSQSADVNPTDNNQNIRSQVASVLGYQRTLSEAAILALIANLKDYELRSMAADILNKVLDNQHMLSAEANTALIPVLTHYNEAARSKAAGILGRQSTLPREATAALIPVLMHDDKEVQSKAAFVLGKQSTLSEETIAALIAVLNHGEEEARSNAAYVLGKQSALSEETIAVLIAFLNHGEEEVRSEAAYVLARQSTLSEEIIATLIAVLNHGEEEVRSKAAYVLGGQRMLPGEAIASLIVALADNNEIVRLEAVGALAYQSALSKEIVSALIAALMDENQEVRSIAANALGKQSTLSKEAIVALTAALADDDWNVRLKAADALGNQSALPKDAITAIITVLKDEREELRSKAVAILGKQSTLPKEAIAALITVFINDNKQVRSNVTFYALGKQSTLPKEAIAALIAALAAENTDVRSNAVFVLGKQSTLPKEAIAALVVALADDKIISWNAAEALGKHSPLPEDALVALSMALMDRDSFTRSKSLKALSKHSTLPREAIAILITALTHENRDVKSIAANFLGKQFDQDCKMLAKLSPEQIKTLYAQVLFPRNYTKAMPLTIQDNQLHFYTATGSSQSVKFTSEHITNIVKGIKAAKAELGVPILSAD